MKNKLRFKPNRIKNLKLVIRDKHISFPRLPIVKLALPLDFKVKLPSIQGINLGGAKTAIATALGVSILTITGAIYFSIQGINPAPEWPKAAVYDAERSQRLGMESIGVGDKPVDRGTMTLQLNLGGGVRVDELVFDNLSIGKGSGLTDAIKISTTAGSIICEKLILDGVEATDLTMTTSTAYTFKVTTTTADGLSISPTLSSNPIKYSYGSSRGSVSIPAVTEGTFDRIIITGSTTSTVGTISFKDVKAYGAGITLQNLNSGEIVIKNSVIGDGSGIDSASFTIASTVEITSSTISGNVEQPISIK